MNLGSPLQSGQKVLTSFGTFVESWQQFFTAVYGILAPIQNSGTSSYYQPLTGSTITTPSGIESIICDPAGTIAALTLSLPTQVINGQPVYFNTTQAITALTVSAVSPTSVSNGASISLPAGGAVGFRYVASKNTWYRCI